VLKVKSTAVADTEGSQGVMPPLEANVPNLPLRKSVESKAGKRDFKNTLFLVY